MTAEDIRARDGRREDKHEMVLGHNRLAHYILKRALRIISNTPETCIERRVVLDNVGDVITTARSMLDGERVTIYASTLDDDASISGDDE